MMRILKYIDPIHGEIIISDIIAAIVETDQFQRLKEIKQLGANYMAFPEAKHTRYEHCIGTYFLSKKLMSSLINNTKFNIPLFYQNCVSIAGLLHDIGHGPFSHFWEHVSTTSHELNSADAIDDIFSTINCTLSDNPNEHKYGIELIKGFITGNKTRLSRPIDKKFEFLFEIINNKQCDIDVDKWDYLLRDAFYTARYLPKKVPVSLNFDSIFTNAMISSDHSHIMYWWKNYCEIYNLFDTRSKFHIYIYQFPMTRVKENILLEAIRVANNRNYKFKGKLLSNISSKNTTEFLALTDENVLTMLRSLNDPDIDNLLNHMDNDNIVEIFPKIDQNNSDIPKFLKVDINIEHGGQKMNEENIYFYGDPGDIKNLVPQRGFYHATHYFGFVDQVQK